MELVAFAVRDDKAEAFLPPFFLPMDAMATRTFVDCCNDPGHAFCKHPEDYKLFRVGWFATDTGVFHPQEHGPLLVVSGLQAVAVKE